MNFFLRQAKRLARRRTFGNLRKISALAPHIKDYDSAKPSLWLPFVMDGMEPNLQSKAMNTDSMGFRYTFGDGNQKMSPQTKSDYPVSLFVGGSTAFGVGATSDGATIPSILARRRKEPWYNLGARGVTITQNLIQFMVFRSEIGSVRRIVLFSGWNEINGFLMAPLYTRYYGAFHGSMRYFQTMNRDKIEFSRKKISFPQNWATLVHSSIDKEISRPLLAEHFRNTLANWKFMADGLNADLIFLLQPVSFCSPHELVEQEILFFSQKKNISKLKRGAEPINGWFSELLAAECDHLGIAFRNCNETFGREVDVPLFIDPLHLTDEGNEEMANIVENVL
jgi:hypothetical protein